MTNPPPGDPGQHYPLDPNPLPPPPEAGWQQAPPPGPNWQAPPPADPGWQQQPGPGWPAGPPPVAPAPAKSNLVWVLVPVVAVVVLLLVGGGVWAAVALKGDDGGDSGKDKQSQVAEPKADNEDGGIVLGGGEPRVEVYLDFICPACGSFQTQNDQLMSEAVAAEDATFVFHPLNFLPSASETDYSLRAAGASVCAADGGKFFEYYQALMRNQPPEGGPGLDDAELVEFGREAGLDDAFADCVDEKRYQPWIERETKKALDSGVNATPTIRIDGKQVDMKDFATEFAAATS